MRPDQIPLRPLATRATLTRADARQLFGTDALTGRETVEVVRLGEVLHPAAPVAIAENTRLIHDARLTPDGSVRLAGPLGAVGATAVPVRTRLVAPAALRRAWGLGDAATVGLGALALAVPVVDGDLALEVEHALWLGAGRPETARWMAGLALPTAPADDDRQRDEGPADIPRRVVTETDVRQAMLRRRRIRLRADQVVTPAARSLAKEHGVFED